VTILGFIARFLARATRFSIALSAALMLAAILYQVVTRYVLGAASSWSEEFAVLMFSWSVLAGLALGVHEGFHVRLTLLTDTLPLAGRIAAERVLDFTTAALGVFLLSYGIWSLRSRIPDRPLSARWAWPSGFIGGLLGTLFGIGGPPYVIYLSRRIMDRDRLRATIAVIVLISLLIRFLVFMAAGLLLQPGLPALLAVVLPLCALGVLVGGRLVERLSRERLLRVIAAVLTISGALLLVRVVAG
jgi:TRAP-type C4-dicarboxylate transport system permease small subunit